MHDGAARRSGCRRLGNIVRMPRQPLPTAQAYLPDSRTLDALNAAARACQGCDLYVHATQTVFGTGPTDARVVLVGEQPGDREDRAGLPFVGPAGAVLDRALARAGIARSEAYVTNAVKHFKFVERGKRRIHQSPKVTEMRVRALARSGNRSDRSRSRHRARRDGGKIAPRHRFPTDRTPRHCPRGAATPARARDDPSVLDSPRARRRITRRGIRKSRCRPRRRCRGPSDLALR